MTASGEFRPDHAMIGRGMMGCSCDDVLDWLHDRPEATLIYAMGTQWPTVCELRDYLYDLYEAKHLALTTRYVGYTNDGYSIREYLAQRL